MSRKKVLEAFANEFPEPAEGECVARIVSSQGGENFIVELPPTEAGSMAASAAGLPQTIARMPSRFRNLIYVRTGNLLIVRATSEFTGGNTRYVFFLFCFAFSSRVPLDTPLRTNSCPWDYLSPCTLPCIVFPAARSVTHAISHVLAEPHAKHLASRGLLPEIFLTPGLRAASEKVSLAGQGQKFLASSGAASGTAADDEEDDLDTMLGVNPNQRRRNCDSSSSEEEGDENEEQDEDEDA
jgi:hypothetical protein